MKISERINRLSLKQKVAVASVLIGTLPAIACGIIAYSLSSNNIQSNLENNTKFISEKLGNDLSRFLSLRVRELETVAELPIFNNPAISKTLTVQQKNQILSDKTDSADFFSSIAYADLKGNVIYESQGKASDNISNRTYFQEVVKNGKSFISSVEISPVTGEKVFHIAVPVKELGTGKLLGVMRSRLPIDKLYLITKGYTENDYIDISWKLLDKSLGEFILSDKKEKVGRKYGEDFTTLPKLIAKKETVTETDIDRSSNTKKLLAYSDMEQSETLNELDLGVLITQDVSVIEAKKNEILWGIAIGASIAGLATAGVAILLSNRAAQFIQKIANGIASSSAEIATTVEQQNRTIAEQASSVTQTTTTVNELGSSSRQAADQAEASANGARQALNLTENGTKAVQQTLSGMTSLKDKVNGIANQIVNLSQQTGQITSVSNLVADIANQTNMLALNAAVEAARAGENGKGFGVVATEIRKLADQSKKSAEKIDNLVADIQAAINKTVMVTDEGTKTVDEGIRLAESTANTFVGVTDAVNNVFLNSQQISLSAKQQAVAIQQVLSAMNELNMGAKESSIGMNQVKASTQTLNQSANDLRDTIT